MFGMDVKSLIVGAALGYFVVPRIVGPIVAKVSSMKPEAAA